MRVWSLRLSLALTLVPATALAQTGEAQKVHRVDLGDYPIRVIVSPDYEEACDPECTAFLSQLNAEVRERAAENLNTWLAIEKSLEPAPTFEEAAVLVDLEPFARDYSWGNPEAWEAQVRARFAFRDRSTGKRVEEPTDWRARRGLGLRRQRHDALLLQRRQQVGGRAGGPSGEHGRPPPGLSPLSRRA